MRAVLLAILGLTLLGGCSRRDRAAKASPPDAAPRKVERPPRKGRTVPALPDPLPGTRTRLDALAGATRGAAGDVDGDGKVELVAAGPKELVVLAVDGKLVARAAVPGEPQVVTVSGGWIWTGFGESREHRGAPARLSRWRLEQGSLREELVHLPETARRQVLAILPPGPDGGDLFAAWFVDKYNVSTATLARDAAGKWAVAPLQKLRMATEWLRADVDGDRRLDTIVGRPYGEDKEAEGDAFLLAADGTRTPIPTTMGVQSLLWLDGELWLGDGWHKDYGRIAVGNLSVARRGPDGWRTEVVEETEGQSALYRLVAADVDGDEDAEIVAVGSDYVRVFKREDRWRGLTIAGDAADVIVVDLDGDGADEVVTLPDPYPTGAPAAVTEAISLKEARWP